MDMGEEKNKKVKNTSHAEDEHTAFSRLFMAAIKWKDFSIVSPCLADDVVQVLYNNRDIVGRDAVVAYWQDWLVRRKEILKRARLDVRFCRFYERDVCGILFPHSRVHYLISRIEDGLVQQMVFCTNPLQDIMIRHWDLDRDPDVLSLKHEILEEIKPRRHRFPCMRCGTKSEELQWNNLSIDNGPIGYVGEMSVCPHCKKTVEFLPTIFYRL